MAKQGVEGSDMGAEYLLSEFASLRKRLSETERKLKREETTHSSPEKGPGLSLSDLTPSSHHERQSEWRESTSRRGIFLGQPVGNDGEPMRRKLALLRQENCQLFSQNHSLLSELEDTSYQLVQSQNRLSEMSEHQPALREHLVHLESQITTKEREIK